MGQTDTNRIQHEIDDLPSIYRNFDVEQILDDISERLSCKGFLEVIRSGIFVDQMIQWEDNTKTKKRVEVTLDRTSDPPFVNTITEDIYSEDGSTIVATITSSITRTGNKLLSSIETIVTRP